MKMIKIYCLMAALLFCVASVSAQVRVGNASDPHEGAILDLKSAETTKKGLLLPNVSLTSLNDFTILGGNKTVGEGMLIYNTNATLGKGLYIWDGGKWTKMFAYTPATEVPTVTISSSLPNTSITNGTAVVLTAHVKTTGTNIYQWYKNGTIISGEVGETDATLSIPSIDVNDRYTCAVINNAGSATDTWSTCGAYISTSEWLPFMCYNLGADTSLPWNTYNTGILGNYYQWGNSTASATYDGGVVGTWTQDNYEIGNTWADDPCPAGWRIPSYAEWRGVLDNNTRTNTGAWTVNNGGGILMGTTLYLPAGSFYNNVGVLSAVGGAGYYWSNTTYSISGEVTRAYNLLFHSGGYSATWDIRSKAFSVRCVAE